MRPFIAVLLLSFTQVSLAQSIFMVPDESWGFKFNSPKLVSQKGDTSETEYQFQASTKEGFILSAFVEPSDGKGEDSKTCMEYYWALSLKNPNIKKDTIKIVEKPPFYVVSYVIDITYQGNRYIQPNENYYGYRDGNCIDFHVSQIFPFGTKTDLSNLVEFGKSFGYFQ